MLSRAWCEAVVQRGINYVDPVNSPETVSYTHLRGECFLEHGLEVLFGGAADAAGPCGQGGGEPGVPELSLIHIYYSEGN